MIIEYIKYAFDNAFRYPKRFLAIIIGVALSTFSILSLLSVTTNMQRINNHMIYSLENSDINYNQLYIQPQTFENPITKDLLNQVLSIKGVDKGYYFEDFSYYIWQFGYLVPWLKFDDKLNLELKPIILDNSSARDYGFEDKLIYGSYFSNDPNEIILSNDVLKRFINEDQVFKDQLVILPEGIRYKLGDGIGESIKPEDIIGKSIAFIYDFQFDIDMENQEKPMYKISHPKSISLKVVGIYEPSIGYQTFGDSWIPLSLMKNMVGIDLDSQNSQMSGQIAIKVTDPTQIQTLEQKVKNIGYYAEPTVEEKPFIASEIIQRNVHKLFYQLALFAAIFSSIISFIVISVLMISEREYDFTLQRAIGASKKQMTILFTLEMFFTSFIGVLFGLFITLLFLQSGLDKLIEFSFFLNGTITIGTIIIIPVFTSSFASIQLNRYFKSQLAIGLAKGGI